MKLAWILFGSVMSFLCIFAVWQNKNIQNENITSDSAQHYSVKTAPDDMVQEEVKAKKEPGTGNSVALPHPSESGSSAYTGSLSKDILPDSIVAYGLKLMGSPYLAAGITRQGFDCSGFINHIYNKYGIHLPHSSALLANEGKMISIDEVKKGDLLIFTGTNVTDRTPGHVGVVITGQGQAIEFVHASSVGGVKISKVAGTGYQKRFLQARRVL